MARELERFRAEHPRSLELAERARRNLLGGVPMNWMVRWPGGFPVFVAEAEGARFVDVDGHEYIDLCLGDTGAMTGHAPAPTVAAIDRQAPRGITLMLPTEDALSVGAGAAAPLRAPALAVRAERHRRQPVRAAARPRDHRAAEDPRLQLVLPRHRRRDVRHARRDGHVVAREGNIGPPVRSPRRRESWSSTTSSALEHELAIGDVACVLAEPAMTNIGIVLPEPGYQTRCASSRATPARC